MPNFSSFTQSTILHFLLSLSFTMDESQGKNGPNILQRIRFSLTLSFSFRVKLSMLYTRPHSMYFTCVCVQIYVLIRNQKMIDVYFPRLAFIFNVRILVAFMPPFWFVLFDSHFLLFFLFLFLTSIFSFRFCFIDYFF